LIFWGEEIFSFVFGEPWQNAGTYAQVMVPWLFAKSIFSPISSIPIVLQKQRQLFAFTLILNLLIPASFIIGSRYYERFESLLLLVSILGFFCVSLMILWIRHISINHKLVDHKSKLEFDGE